MTSPTQEFTSKNLGWMRRHRRQFGLTPDSGKAPRSRAEWADFLSELEADLSKEKFKFDRIKVSQFKRGNKIRQIASTKSLNEVLVIRRINENIRRAYGIKNPNRTALVGTLRQAIREGTKKQILRVDIKSCFESIPRALMLKRLMTDGLVSFQTVSLLARLFEVLEGRASYIKRRGLPRGLAISSTLAEIYLLGIERAIRSLPGVYLVIRYVDDIVIFSSDVNKGVLSEVKRVVGEYRLKLNCSKTKCVTVACECDGGCLHGIFCPCGKKCTCISEDRRFEYLGYSFSFSSRNSKSGINSVKLTLSEQKLKRIKSRIVLSTRAYVSSGDFETYLDRIGYMVANLQLISDDGSRGLSTGLAYTHSEYSIPREMDAAEAGDLTRLNEFLRRSIRFGLKLRPQPPNLVKKAFKYDFVSGYHNKRRVKLSRGQLLKIVECWRHV